MAGIRVLKEFLCDVTTSHVTEGNYPLWRDDQDSLNGHFYSFLRRMDPTLPYVSIIILFLWGLGSFWSKFMSQQAVAASEMEFQVALCIHRGDSRWQPLQPSFHGFNRSPPGFQATGSKVLLNDSIWRFLHIVVHQKSKILIARDLHLMSHGKFLSPRLMSCESSRFGLSMASFLIVVFHSA